MGNKLNDGELSQLIEQFKKKKNQADFIDPSLMPGIDLYMDQVTTFMDEHLKNTKRYPEDKILTKTMINNYAKNSLLPSPEKKKYSKDHLLLLTFIYYYKSFLSINDIQTLLTPITEKYFKTDKNSNFSLEDIYSSIYQSQKDIIHHSLDDIDHVLSYVLETCEDAPSSDKELLSIFNFVAHLSYDIFLKKQLVEQIIDQLNEYNQQDKFSRQADKQDKSKSKQQKNK